MKAIVISEKKLEEILAETRKELELTKFREYMGDAKTKEFLSDMHRRFNCHVCTMIRKIKDEY